MPMTIQTPRITINDTTIDGILDKPAKANWVSSTPIPRRECSILLLLLFRVNYCTVKLYFDLSRSVVVAPYTKNSINLLLGRNNLFAYLMIK